MDFSKLAACCVAVAEVVSGCNGCIATEWAFHADCHVHIIIGMGKGYHCRILNKAEQSIGRVENKPLFPFRISSRLFQAFRKIDEVCTEVQTGIKQLHTKLSHSTRMFDGLKYRQLFCSRQTVKYAHTGQRVFTLNKKKHEKEFQEHRER